MNTALIKMILAAVMVASSGCTAEDKITEVPLGTLGDQLTVTRQNSGGATVDYGYYISIYKRDGKTYPLVTMWRLSCLSVSVSGKDILIYYSEGTRIKDFTNIVYTDGNEYEVVLERTSHCRGVNLIR